MQQQENPTSTGRMGCVPVECARRSRSDECAAELQQASALFNPQLVQMLQGLQFNIFNSLWTNFQLMCMLGRLVGTIGLRSRIVGQFIFHAQLGWTGFMVVCSFSLSTICFLGCQGAIWGAFPLWWRTYARSIICLIGVYRFGRPTCRQLGR